MAIEHVKERVSKTLSRYKTTSVGSAKRQRVIDVTAGTFAQFGYHGVSTRQIAEILGIKVGSLYFHLNSKETALEEVCLRGLEIIVHAIEQAIQNTSGLSPRLRQFFTKNLEDIRLHSDYIVVYIHEYRHLTPAAHARLESLSRSFRKHLDRLFCEALDDGELFENLSPRAASLIMIGTVRNISQFYTDGPVKHFDQFAKDAVDSLIRGVTRA